MEIKIETEKTVEQIGMQMWEIVGRITDICFVNIANGTALNADELLRDEVVQEKLLQYERLICLIESVKPVYADTEWAKKSFNAKASKEPAHELFRRLFCHLSEAKNPGQMLSAYHQFVPVLVHRMRVEGIIKEGGEDE